MCKEQYTLPHFPGDSYSLFYESTGYILHMVGIDQSVSNGGLCVFIGGNAE